MNQSTIDIIVITSIILAGILGIILGNLISKKLF